MFKFISPRKKSQIIRSSRLRKVIERINAQWLGSWNIPSRPRSIRLIRLPRICGSYRRAWSSASPLLVYVIKRYQPVTTRIIAVLISQEGRHFSYSAPSCLQSAELVVIKEKSEVGADQLLLHAWNPSLFVLHERPHILAFFSQYEWYDTRKLILLEVI